MNRNENEAESFAGNFMAFGEEALFFEVPSCRSGDNNAQSVARACCLYAWNAWRSLGYRRCPSPELAILSHPVHCTVSAGRNDGPDYPARSAVAPPLWGRRQCTGNAVMGGQASR